MEETAGELQETHLPNKRDMGIDEEKLKALWILHFLKENLSARFLMRFEDKGILRSSSLPAIKTR